MVSYLGAKMTETRIAVDVPLGDSRTLRIAVFAAEDYSPHIEAELPYLAELERATFYAHIVGSPLVPPSFVYYINAEGRPAPDADYRVISTLQSASDELNIPQNILASYLCIAFPEWTSPLRFFDEQTKTWMRPPDAPNGLFADPEVEENADELYTDAFMDDGDSDVTYDAARTFGHLDAIEPQMDSTVDALVLHMDEISWEELHSLVTHLWVRGTLCNFPVTFALLLLSCSKDGGVEPVLRNAPFDPMEWARKCIQFGEYNTKNVDGLGLRRTDESVAANGFMDCSQMRMTFLLHNRRARNRRVVERFVVLGEVFTANIRLDDGTRDKGAFRFGIFVDGTAIIESGEPRADRGGQPTVPIKMDFAALGRLYAVFGGGHDFSDMESFGTALLAVGLSAWRARMAFCAYFGTSVSDIGGEAVRGHLAACKNACAWLEGDTICDVDPDWFDVEFVNAKSVPRHKFSCDEEGFLSYRGV
ncbi:hypothetical protein HDU89_007602 [Geranomyces variabilis]|nr:hypothetical protein HDU89_007602 [Geranomyces variabilis]